MQDAVLAALSKGVHPDERDRAERTPLIVAAKHGHAPVCQLLLDSAASPSAADARGMSALHHACCSGHAAIVDMLLTAANEAAEAGNVHCAVAASGPAAVRPSLQEQRVRKTQSPYAAAPPLHMAIEHGALECARVLLTGGCNAASRSAGGETALHVAARKSSKDAVNLLLLQAPELLTLSVCLPSSSACRTAGVASTSVRWV